MKQVSICFFLNDAAGLVQKYMYETSVLSTTEHHTRLAIAAGLQQFPFLLVASTSVALERYVQPD